MSVVPAEVARAAIRGLRLPEAERTEKLAGSHPEVKQRIEAEMGTISCIAACFVIWQEHGVMEEVLAYLVEFARAHPSELPDAA